ncbi:DNA primase [Parabacteroides gordonii]|uniref:DNA primase n=1 Tax=Parabacteroides gordonii MS-1 = DSM 23371 TaxID=1203610 RepID=A0A0F5IVI1_9BACT|nr:CHC2 zinc finger domain-containing protein [Parabacteroides gordonii]KKB49553.1 DNA primase [Parabacteroides gordonii MS-1 = DSM 23371]MCA5585815.1 toprim domain-containing protein [Parabacteroides gordonii]
MTHQEINNIKQSAPQIEEVIGRYVQLTRKGKSLLGLCPFHEDHHPSLSVNPEKQYFTCFACGEKGDVIHFLQKIEGLSFGEAMKKLKIENGKLKIKSEVKPEVKLTKRVCETEKRNLLFFSSLLPAASGDSDLTPTWLDFGVGTSPAMVVGEWKAMRNRLVFPIRDEEGILVGFGARRLTETSGSPKYINSPTSELYRKNEILYGLHIARKVIREKQYAILVEGYKDVLAMHAAGFRNTVALCGTALCDGHIALLKKYTSRVLVMLDADTAGRKASEKAVYLLRMQGIRAYGVELPEGEDPDSLFRLWGKDRFTGYLRKKLVQDSPSEEALLLERIRTGIQTLSGITDTTDRMQALRRLNIGIAHLAGLSRRQKRPATMDWRWV